MDNLKKLIKKYEEELKEIYTMYETENPYEIDNVKDRTLALTILNFINQLEKTKKLRIDKKVPFSFEGTPKKLNNGMAFWTDGIMISCDNEPNAAFYLKKGKKYKVSIEEVK